MSKNGSKVTIMSVNFLKLSKNDYTAIVKKRISSGKRTIIFTPNPQILLGAKKNKEAQKALQSANINLPDGSGIIMASRILRSPIKEAVCGIDFAEDILALAQENNLSIFLLGGKKGRAEQAKQMLNKKFPSLKICGTYHGYFCKLGQENEVLINQINTVAPDIIFVCFGFPEQEKWISQNAPLIPSCKLAIGLGGSIDVWSGHVKRAPDFLRKVHLEWLYRAIKEPRRLHIFWDIPVFLLNVLEQKNKRRSAKAKRQ